MDQQLRVTRYMIDCQDLDALPPEQARLRSYMTQYLSTMMAISGIFLILDGSPEAKQKKADLWAYLKERVSPGSTGGSSCLWAAPPTSSSPAGTR